MMGGIALRTGEYQVVETHTFDYEKNGYEQHHYETY
jgi:hypothetical protein